METKTLSQSDPRKIRQKKSVTKKRRTAKPGQMDYIFLLLVLLLLTIGLVSLFSASFAHALKNYGNSFHFIARQVIFAVGGVAVMLFMSRVDYRFFERIVWFLYFFTLILLVLVYFFKPLNGARRWIIIGSITFQPSELAKFVTAVLFAHLININHDQMNTFQHGLLPQMVILMPIILLILFETHLSGTIIVISIALSLLFIGGVKIRWFVLLGALVALMVYLIAITGAIKYVKPRIDMWRNPWSDPLDKGYQTLQSLFAIGSGGLMGVGIGGSSQKYSYLPELQNDYIFAVVCEEVGFVGATIIILLFVLLVWRGFVIGMRCKNRFGALLAIGIAVQVGTQVLLNIMVVTNTIPSTGISLPFFSSGGTSLIMLLAEMGVLLSISRQTEVEEEYTEIEITNE